MGVDIGTSSVAAAIARTMPGRAPEIRRLSFGARRLTSAAAFLDDDGSVSMGETAEQRGLAQPERLVRGFVDRVGDLVPIMAGTRRIMAEDLYARAVQSVVRHAESRSGGPPSAVAVAVPPRWAEGTVDLVRQALAGRGLHTVSLADEAEAAAVHHSLDAHGHEPAVTIVYDLGATRLDVSVVTIRDGVPLRLATERMHGRGGSWFDDAVVRHVIAHSDDAFAEFDSSDPGSMASLADLRRACVEGREALSDVDEVRIRVRMPSGQSDVRLSRRTLENLVGYSVATTGEAVRRALNTSGSADADDATVLLVGGSSRAPMIRAQLADELGRPVVVSSDPDGAVARGAAILAARGAAITPAETGAADPEEEAVDPRGRVPWFRRSQASRLVTARRAARTSVSRGAVGAERAAEVDAASGRREATG